MTRSTFTLKSQDCSTEITKVQTYVSTIKSILHRFFSIIKARRITRKKMDNKGKKIGYYFEPFLFQYCNVQNRRPLCQQINTGIEKLSVKGVK
jgi:hypothetical protein